MAPKTGPARLLFLVTEDWYFMSHRLPMARAAAKAGYQVHVATRLDRHADQIRREGFEVHSLGWSRGSINPLRLLRCVRDVRRIYHAVDPAIVHQVALQPVVVGSIAALGMPIQCLSAITGLGFSFGASSLKAKLMRAALRTVLRYLFSRRQCHVLVQNPNDYRFVLSLGVPEARLSIIPGSGVNVSSLSPLSEPQGPITAGFVGRILGIKGVRTLIAAHEILVGRGAALRLLIAGRPDPSNHDSIPPREIESWQRLPGVKLLGHVDDIRTVWAAAHIAVQPSHGGEGVPKSLIEAAACGKPIVASDVPGCRDVVVDGVNGILVPPGDAVTLADAIAALAADPALRHRYGMKSRELAETRFANEQVAAQITEIYRRLSEEQRRRA